MIDRLLLTAGIALLVTLVLGPFLIPLLHVLKFGQNVRDDGPKSHLKKAGTPTMGGIIFLAGIIVAVLVMAEKPASIEIVVLLAALLAFGLLGFCDDFIKVAMHRSLGLRAYQKLIGQIILSFALCWVAVNWFGRGTDMIIPFTDFHWELGWFYYPLAIFIIVGIVNAVNLTDGLDGLAAGSVALSGAGYALVALLAISQGGGVPVLAHDSDAAVFAVALIGGCLGFLRYNAHPARVFMGDTGSLALGGALAGLAVLTKSELVLLIIGGVYVVEAFSDIIQVIYFKRTGKRFFRMAPLHHHFELSGWSEWKVVLVFWTASFLCALLGVMGFLPTLG